MICIINYGSGNLRSIYNGFRKIGQNPIVSDDISKIKLDESGLLEEEKKLFKNILDKENNLVEGDICL